MVTMWRQGNPVFINKRNGFAENNIIFISFYPDTWINLEMGDGTTKELYFATTEKSFEEANDFCDSEGAILFEPKGLSMHLSINFNTSSIYSCSIGHIWEHEFCHLGCWAVKGKFLKRRNFCLSMLLFGLVFSIFWGQKKNLNFFLKTF